jgi:hypothetical protein
MKWQRPALLWTAVLAAGLGLWAGHRLSPGPSASQAAPATAVKPTLQAAIPCRRCRCPTLKDSRWTCAPLRRPPAVDQRLGQLVCALRGRNARTGAFRQAQGDNGVQVLGLALDTPDDVRGFLLRVPVDYPIVIETPGPRDASVQLGNTQGLLPYSVLFDAQGRLVKAKLGPFAHGEIDGWVK